VRLRDRTPLQRLGRVVVLVGILLVATAFAAATPLRGWLTFNGSSSRTEVAATVGDASTSWFTPLPGMVTTQPLVVSGVPRSGTQTVIVGTAAGYVYALAPNGYVRWRVDLGQQLNSCPQIPDGWGVTGTPVVDESSRTLYVVDAFGRLHGLDVATGRERPGWPIVLYRNYAQELDWGALALVGGSVYIPTGSFCDQPPMQGQLIRVVLANKQVSRWVSVPSSLGGGGSIWGWGGATYSTTSHSLFVGTANTFEGGSNTGSSFDQQAGYGEQLVQLSPDLSVLASSKPDLGSFPDNGFVGSPVIVNPPGCGELVATQTKSGAFIGWKASDIGAGPVWQLQVQKSDPAAPLLTELAWSPALRSFYDVTWTSLLRLQIGDDCKPHLLWQRSLGQATLEGSPTVAGNSVWFAVSNASSGLVEVNATTGRRITKIPVGGISFTPPTVVGGRLYMGAVHGFASGDFGSSPGPVSALPGYRSASDVQHRWQSRENGVFSSDDGGKTWRRIYPSPAVRVVRTSARDGVISVGSPAPACNCTTKRLWTDDNGKSWHQTARLGPGFDGSGGNLYWWDAAGLYQLDRWPPRTTISSSRLAVPGGGIVDDALLSGGGIAVLVDRRLAAPQVIITRAGRTRTVTLPAAGGAATVRAITAVGPTLTVTGHSYESPTSGPDPTVTWRSTDGGTTWQLTAP
jgi:PQQ-like domain